MADEKTVLAIGAHYDDCVFGVPGILLQAVRKHYRVVTLTLIGDYTNWPPIGDRHRELLIGTKAIAKEYGVDMRYLGFRSQQFDVNLDAKKAVARAVADVQPDIAFQLWPHDSHSDHEVAAQLSKAALRHAGRLVEAPGYRPPSRMYYYDNGPRHTIGFEPDTFVDVTDDWARAVEWLGRFAALVKNEEFTSLTRYPTQDSKETQARYRGKTAGLSYSEALRAFHPYPREIL